MDTSAGYILQTDARELPAHQHSWIRASFKQETS